MGVPGCTRQQKSVKTGGGCPLECVGVPGCKRQHAGRGRGRQVCPVGKCVAENSSSGQVEEINVVGFNYALGSVIILLFYCIICIY